MAAGANKEDDKFAIHSSFYIAKKLEEERVEEERVVFWPYRLEWEKNAKKLEEERVEEERVVFWPYRLEWVGKVACVRSFHINSDSVAWDRNRKQKRRLKRPLDLC